MLNSMEYTTFSSGFPDSGISPAPVDSVDNTSLISNDLSFEIELVKETPLPYFRSRHQTFDESTSTYSTLTSDDFPCFDSFPTERNTFGKSLFTFPNTYGSLSQNPYFSNNAYGCTSRFSRHRFSYDFDYPPGLYNTSFEGDDLSARISPDMQFIDHPSTFSSICNLNGESVTEDFSNSFLKPYSNHSLFDNHPLFSTSDTFLHSTPFKKHSLNDSSVSVSSCDESPHKESKLKESSPPFVSQAQKESIEIMDVKTTSNPITRPRHKGPIKKVTPDDETGAPGNPDDIDPTVNPRVFSGKKPKKNMDYSRYVINIDKVKNGEDSRLTLMLKNIPNGFTQSFMLEILDSFVKNEYDFFYMPVDFKTNCNLGFGYVSMTSTASVLKLYNALNRKRWPNTPSAKVCEVNYARMQGQNDMQKLCKDWAIMQLPEKYRPVFFEKNVVFKDGKEIVVMKRTNSPM